MAEKITATTTITETESVLGEKYHTVELKILMSYSDWCQFSKSQLYQDLEQYVNEKEYNHQLHHTKKE